MKIFANSKRMFLDDHLLPPNLWKGQLLLDLLDAGEDLISDYVFPLWTHLLKVHTLQYLNNLQDGSQNNGYGTTDQKQRACALHNVESFCAATKYALKHGAAFSPSAGFHHAHSDRAGGFCTYNGLMVAIAACAPGKKVLIIDGDGHVGDGCLSIMKDNPYTGMTAYYTTSAAMPGKAIDVIKRHLNIEQWDLVMYQAGADAHMDDVYGVGTFNTEQFQDRDRVVFEMCKARNIPVVWNIAGGYGAPEMSDTINLHYASWLEARKVFG